jgi:DNA polymerase III subunit gamma/tau
MDNYLVSARKYRPATFRSVVGQKALTTTLKNAISANKLAHAYLFCGPRGVGKTTCARIFAKTINCLDLTPEGEACNQCESCAAMNEQRSFNIHELDAASNNSVDDIRSLIEQVRIPPQIGKYKVYIIDEVHMLSTAAFNAFLKTLEEPPHHAIFILATTEKHKVLPTILSRCQIYDFSRISLSDTVDHLRHVAEQENVQAEDEALNVIAQKADGGMRDALSIFDQVVSFTGGNITYKAVIENLNVLDYEYFFKLTENILSQDVVESWLTLNEVLNKGFDGQSFLTGLASHFRDLLLCKDQRTAQLFEVGSSIRDRYIQLALRCETNFLYKAIEWVNDCDMKYRLSRNKRLLMDLLFVYLCQAVSPNESGDEKKKIIKPIANNTGNAEPVVVSEPKPSNTPYYSGPAKPNLAGSQQKGQTDSEKPQTDTQKIQTSKKSISLGGIGVSLSSLGQPKEEKKEEKELITGNEKQPFTQQQLELEWDNYIKALNEEEVLLTQTMNQCSPVLISASEFEVVVNNPGQKERLEEKATGILSALRLSMKNFSIRMQVRVSENNEKKLAFTSEEKFRLMVEQNSALLKLKDEFNLELD